MKLDPTRPRAVPQIRDYMTKFMDTNEDIADAMFLWERRILTHENLKMIWIDADMVEAALEIAPSIPVETTLDMLDRPIRALVMLAREIEGIDTLNPEYRIQVNGILWGPITIVPDGREGTSIASISSYRDAFPGIPAWSPIGRTEWLNDENLETVRDHQIPPSVPEDNYERSLLEDRRLFAAIVSLMNQDRYVDTKQWTPHSKSSKRKHGDVSVTTISLKKSKVYSGTRQQVTGTPLDHRVLVAPYMRMQPYGPNSSLRRLQLIEGYVRGPEDAPIVTKEKVWTLRK